MKHEFKLNNNQIRALKCFLWCNPCESGCCYQENQDKKIECDQCEFEKAKLELFNIFFNYDKK